MIEDTFLKYQLEINKKLHDYNITVEHYMHKFVDHSKMLSEKLDTIKIP
jgi:hypothetical protein